MNCSEVHLCVCMSVREEDSEMSERRVKKKSTHVDFHRCQVNMPCLMEVELTGFYPAPLESLRWLNDFIAEWLTLINIATSSY